MVAMTFSVSPVRAIVFFLSISVISCASERQISSANDVEAKAKVFMESLNQQIAKSQQLATEASWAFSTNITDENQQKMIEASQLSAQTRKDLWNETQVFKDDWKNFTDPILRRQFFLFSDLGEAALSKDDFGALTNLEAEMSKRYGTGTICDFNNSTKCDLLFNPHLRNLLKTSRDNDELVHIWTEWRNAVGKPARKQFEDSVVLKNKAALLNGYSSMADMWTSAYESDTFESDVQSLFDQVRPLYQQLHAYARRKLRKVYGEGVVSKRGPIPAHLFGNMWAQQWNGIENILTPFPDKTKIDITEEMVRQNYTVIQMFEMADDFFVSLNLSRVPDSFWNLSMLVKPDDRDVRCHASAWDFQDRQDVRIKQCTAITLDDFETVHHEMGHIQYFILYKDQPYIFRTGANPGFHEAVGDVLSLSVVTPEHLHKIGLLKSISSDQQADINFLLSSGLQKIAFLPFGYLIDKWRWDVFRGAATPQNYTCSWWKYRYQFQGIKPPVLRTENDFDPSAKSHINSYTPYIRYFVSHILQFQFHKSACLAAGKYDPNDPSKPLHRCDIYQSTEAGDVFGNMLRLGGSQHWTVALKELTGTDKMDASALLEYFQPLKKWLEEDNIKNGEFVGWEGETDNFCPPEPTPVRSDEPIKSAEKVPVEEMM